MDAGANSNQSGIQFGAEGCGSIAPIRSFSRVWLYGNRIGDLGCDIPSKDLHRLTLLDAGGNSLGALDIARYNRHIFRDCVSHD